MDIASPSEYLEQAQMKYAQRMSNGLFRRTNGGNDKLTSQDQRNPLSAFRLLPYPTH
jgi:hypothetical protein